jgi:hypothetical protein
MPFLGLEPIDGNSTSHLVVHFLLLKNVRKSHLASHFRYPSRDLHLVNQHSEE